MRKLFLSVLCVLWCIGLFAQKTTQKKTLFVDYITHTASIGSSYPTMLKNAVIGGMQLTGRLNIVDAELEPSLKLEEERRSSAEAIGDGKSRTEMMKKLGADFIMRIHVTQMDAVKKVNEDKSFYYDGLINFTISVMNALDGTIKVSRPFTYAGLTAKTGDTPEAAVVATTDYIKISMNKFVNDHFKLESRIVAIEQVGKKGAETVYVDCGSALGISKGQVFEVFVEKEVAGRVVRSCIGQVQVEEVQGEDMSLCKVKKGGDLIKKYNDEQIELPVVSGKKKEGIIPTIDAFLK